MLTKIRLLPFLLCVLLSETLFAQQTSLSQYDQSESVDPREWNPTIDSDIDLFLNPIEGGEDLFTQLAQYNFSYVRYLRRGYDRRWQKEYLNGIDVSDAVSGYPVYSWLSAAGDLRASREYSNGLAASVDALGSLNGIKKYSVRARDVAAGSKITVGTSDRYYRMFLDASTSALSANGKWAYAAALDRRFGRDAHIDGVFTDAGVATISADRIFSDKSALSLMVTIDYGVRGQRSASVAEAFDLTGNPLYNPSWGYQAGKVRNAKVADDSHPLIMATYDLMTSKKSQLTASLAYSFGRSKYSSLSWNNAQNPAPDYYRYMPSYFADQTMAQNVTQQWRSKDPDVVQLDWAEFFSQNSLADGAALYFVEDRVERFNDFQVAVSGSTRVNKKVEVGYGIRARRDQRNNHKRMKDLLGAGYALNTDQYLSDEDVYLGGAQNDLNNPNRQVLEGDRFGYDYKILFSDWRLFSTLFYRERSLRLSAALELGGSAFSREGLYDKQSPSPYPSFGRSAKQNYSTYNVKLGAGYSFSPRHAVDAVVMVGADYPLPEGTFAAPQYSNHIPTNAETLKITSAELNYNMSLTLLRLKLAVYYTSISDESRTYRYYDDLSAQYSNMMVRGIAHRHYGFEVGADIDIAHGLQLRLAASMGNFTYSADPKVDIYADADLSKTVANETAYMKGFKVGSTPQSVASAEIRYNGVFGWLASLSLNYAGESFIDPSPLRRMNRVLSSAYYPELMSELTRQEKFPAAFTVNLFMLKSFTIKKSDFYVIGSLNNLLNNRDIVRSGFEQMRLRKSGSGAATTYHPFASKYLYSYGRTFYLSLNYKF